MATDHFEKHKWARGRTDWNFNILFDDQPQVAQYAARYRGALNHPGLYQPIPEQWLHSTVLRVGFVEDFTEEEMFEVVARIQPKLAKVHLPEFLLGQWWIWSGNPCVHFTPEDPLHEVFNIIIEELEAVVGKHRLPEPLTFTPHISLAYSKTYDDEIGLFTQLQAEHVAAIPVQVRRLSLVRQQANDNLYTWHVVKQILIGQSTTSDRL